MQNAKPDANHHFASTLSSPLPEPEKPPKPKPKKVDRRTPAPRIDDPALAAWLTRWQIPPIVTLTGKRTPEAEEVERFIDRQAATGATYIDWAAAWRTWMRNAKSFRPGASWTAPRRLDEPSQPEPRSEPLKPYVQPPPLVVDPRVLKFGLGDVDLDAELEKAADEVPF